MKTYKFPYGGADWDSFVEFELTEEEAARLEASAKAEPRWHLDEDEAISDICKKIKQFIVCHCLFRQFSHLTVKTELHDCVRHLHDKENPLFLTVSNQEKGENAYRT